LLLELKLIKSLEETVKDQAQKADLQWDELDLSKTRVRSIFAGYLERLSRIRIIIINARINGNIRNK
jgi:hypothetical protein